MIDPTWPNQKLGSTQDKTYVKNPLTIKTRLLWFFKKILRQLRLTLLTSNSSLIPGWPQVEFENYDNNYFILALNQIN
jgi:hypothetical protein